MDCHYWALLYCIALCCSPNLHEIFPQNLHMLICLSFLHQFSLTLLDHTRLQAASSQAACSSFGAEGEARHHKERDNNGEQKAAVSVEYVSASLPHQRVGAAADGAGAQHPEWSCWKLHTMVRYSAPRPAVTIFCKSQMFLNGRVLTVISYAVKFQHYLWLFEQLFFFFHSCKLSLAHSIVDVSSSQNTVKLHK